ncbi:MAG: alkaline phosphatase family protein [Polyangiales bacterium]|nr:alkaline phosphatase family protein [Myxococcales bacterium]
MARTRALVVGLDCAAPHLVFGPYVRSMPHLARLMERGVHGPLRSSVPPITVPAWTCMFSGRDAGELGLYGFRNRVRGSYALTPVRGDDVREKRVWDSLGEAGLRVAPLFVPPSNPPPGVRGVSAGCFLLPKGARPWTFPPSVGERLEARFGAYENDMTVHGDHVEPESVRDALWRMSAQHFDMAADVWANDDPDLLAFVDIGVDRFQHVFFEHMDPTHPRHDPTSPWNAEGERYFAHLDRKLGELLEVVGADTHVFVVSDHGARPLQGSVRINQWLVDNGWLALKDRPAPNHAVTPEHIDWRNTRAWGEGGYYARVWLNVAGREPEGTIAPGDFERTRDALRRELLTIETPTTTAPHRILAPDECFRAARGVPPDLMVFFGNLALRSLGTLGAGEVFTTENDRGADACNHDWDGMFVAAGPKLTARGPFDGASLFDVGATLASIFDVTRPTGTLGQDWSQR